MGLDAARLALLGAGVSAESGLGRVCPTIGWTPPGPRTCGPADKPVAAGLDQRRRGAHGGVLLRRRGRDRPHRPARRARDARARGVHRLGVGATTSASRARRFSVLPYIVSFGLLPLIVTLALPTPTTAALWAMGMGALLGVAAHFTNVVPDLDDDRRTGVRGLPHLLGPRVGWSRHLPGSRPGGSARRRRHGPPLRNGRLRRHGSDRRDAGHRGPGHRPGADAAADAAGCSG